MINKLIYNNKIMSTVILVLFLSVSIFSGMRLVQANDNVHYDKTFVTIEIHQGDTLTSIAEEYAVSESDYRSYINEVKEINNLKSETIHAGCYLLIPVYHFVQ